MERLKQKLNSRRGASILLAMLLMLVAVMISAVIVSAAVTASNRVGEDPRQEQEILALDSAAKAMVKYLKRDGSYEYKDEESTNRELLADPGRTEIHSAPVMEYFAAKLDSSAAAVPFTLTAEMTPPDELPPAAALDGARMTLTAQYAYESSTDNSNIVYYNVTGKVYTGDDPDKSPQKLYVEGTISKTEEYSECIVTVTTYVPNGAYDPSNPDSLPELPVDVPVRIEITTTTWSVGTMTLTTNQPT